MIQNSKSNFFYYNKQDELVRFVELSNDNLVGYYSIEDNILTRLNIYRGVEKNKAYTDTNKSKVAFAEDVKLFHIFIDGENLCKVVKKNGLSPIPPKTLSKVYTHNDDGVQGATLNPTLVQDWLKKL
jgi:hypothetical protein